VDECDKHTISASRFLEEVVKLREMKVFHALWNRATFHYDQQLPLLSLEEIAEKQPDRQWSCLAGSEPLDWRFELADAAVDRMMIREVFRLRGPQGQSAPPKLKIWRFGCRTSPTDLRSSRFTSSATFRVRYLARD
jgi:hypothetical protein